MKDLLKPKKEQVPIGPTLEEEHEKTAHFNGDGRVHGRNGVGGEHRRIDGAL
jgi:hypothetical protein